MPKARRLPPRGNRLSRGSEGSMPGRGAYRGQSTTPERPQPRHSQGGAPHTRRPRHEPRLVCRAHRPGPRGPRQGEASPGGRREDGTDRPDWLHCRTVPEPSGLPREGASRPSAGRGEHRRSRSAWPYKDDPRKGAGDGRGEPGADGTADVAGAERARRTAEKGWPPLCGVSDRVKDYIDKEVWQWPKQH